MIFQNHGIIRSGWQRIVFILGLGAVCIAAGCSRGIRDEPRQRTVAAPTPVGLWSFWLHGNRDELVFLDVRRDGSCTLTADDWPVRTARGRWMATGSEISIDLEPHEMQHQLLRDTQRLRAAIVWGNPRIDLPPSSGPPESWIRCYRVGPFSPDAPRDARFYGRWGTNDSYAELEPNGVFVQKRRHSTRMGAWMQSGEHILIYLSPESMTRPAAGQIQEMRLWEVVAMADRAMAIREFGFVTLHIRSRSDLEPAVPATQPTMLPSATPSTRPGAATIMGSWLLELEGVSQHLCQFEPDGTFLVQFSGPRGGVARGSWSHNGNQLALFATSSTIEHVAVFIPGTLEIALTPTHLTMGPLGGQPADAFVFRRIQPFVKGRCDRPQLVGAWHDEEGNFLIIDPNGIVVSDMRGKSCIAGEWSQAGHEVEFKWPDADFRSIYRDQHRDFRTIDHVGDDELVLSKMHEKGVWRLSRLK